MPTGLSRPRAEMLPDNPADFPRWQATDDVTQLVSLMDPHSAGSAIREPLREDNGWLLVPAPSAAVSFPATLSKNGTFVQGTPGTLLKALTVKTGAKVRLTGVRVTGAVLVEADAVLIATNCKFETQVAVQALGRAHFIGCNTAGVTNAGALANVYIIGCHRDSGANFGVTVVAETT